MTWSVKHRIAVPFSSRLFLRPVLAGYPPCGLSARNNQKQAVELLIGKGADVNVKNWSGQTPLDVAFSRYYKKTTELLLEKGANTSQSMKGEIFAKYLRRIL